MENKNNVMNEALRIGLVVFILLLVLSIGEYFVGSIAYGWTLPLWGIAIFKAALIMRDYMHVSRLFARDEEKHS